MKRRSLLQLAALATLVVFGASACSTLQGVSGGGGESSAQSSRLPAILKSGTLRVGMSGSQPPLNMKNKAGDVIGLEVDLIQALAGSMGLEAELDLRPFRELLPALEKGEVDLVISGMTITPERNSRVAFAGPYFISGKSVLTKQARLSNVDNTAALDDPSRTYAALAGSTSERFVQDVLPHAKLITTPDYDAGVQMVIDDKVDALVADYPICVLSVLRHPLAGLSTLVTPFTVEPLGIALPANDPLFVNLVENYLNTLEGTGLLTQLKAKWFSDGSWVSDLP